MDHSAPRHAKINCRSRWLPGFFWCSGAYGPQLVPIRVYKEYGPDFCVMCFLIGKMFYVSFG